jgi:hypothetical protein
MDLGGTSDFPGPTAQDRRLEKLALDAVWRQATAETYKVLIVELQDSEGRLIWKPESRACHSNVETWIRHSPAHKRVRGLLLQGPFFNFWRVLAHSLVQVEDGSLVEITPQEGNQLHPFVRHLGTEDEFEEFANRGKLIVRPPR